MEMESCVPPGFRFHPTDEELVGYYLKRKINSLKIDLDVIIDIDLYKMEPWDIQARCKLGYDEQTEWYFFSHKDRKYPTGTRTNRATAAGFWKATGRDKAVVSKDKVIGMRKTLVFYKGRAPNGRKTDWIMHEYRLQTIHQEEGWVVCKAFKKPIPNQRPSFEAWNNHTYCANFRPPLFSDNTMLHNPNQTITQPIISSSKQDSFLDPNNQLIDLPQLDSPTTLLSSSFANNNTNNNFHLNCGSSNNNNGVTNDEFDEEKSTSTTKFIDWKNLDGLLALQATDHITSSPFPISNLPTLTPQTYDFEAHNNSHDNHFLDCFLDS